MYRKQTFIVMRILLLSAFLLNLPGYHIAHAQSNPNDPGLLEPVLSATTGQEVRIPHTDQVANGQQLNIVGNVVSQQAQGTVSLTGHPITQVASPHDDMEQALKDLKDAAKDNDQAAMQAAANELQAILLGTTQGRIYDGFAMLNYNRGAFVADHVPGEYKMKILRDSGQTEMGMDGQPRKIWEADVNMLWYDEEFDADTYLLRVPVAAHEFDTFRINYRIYSLEREEFSPTLMMNDRRQPGSVQFPFKGLDSVWEPINGDTVTTITVAYPPLGLLNGIYTWGWRLHPPRIHFLQPVFEITNAHTGQVELNPEGQSFALRNRLLTINDIGDAAPEKKMYNVAQAALSGATPNQVKDMLTKANVAPRGTWQEWANQAENQRQLPPEAWDVLAAEGISQGTFGPYRFVMAYLNQEVYGEGPQGDNIQTFTQGDRFPVKVINLDNNSHYYRLVDFGPRLHNDIAGLSNGGGHSFEVFDFKPFYGVPKVAELQWRAGWGFRPGMNVIQQQDVFPRPQDSALLQTYFDGSGIQRSGYQFSPQARQGDFRVNVPPMIIGTMMQPSAQGFKEGDGSDGLLIGQGTEGFGVARGCSLDAAPMGQFCPQDLAPFNPNGAKNMDMDGDGVMDVLLFPPFLRNPNPNGGDIFPPTPAWKPFLHINPNNGSLYIDPNDPSKGFWADLTFAHGRPIPGGTSLTANIEAPRAAGQVFYQFDHLYHDNAIFSPHPQ